MVERGEVEKKLERKTDESWGKAQTLERKSSLSMEHPTNGIKAGLARESRGEKRGSVGLTL